MDARVLSEFTFATVAVFVVDAFSGVFARRIFLAGSCKALLVGDFLDELIVKFAEIVYLQDGKVWLNKRAILFTEEEIVNDVSRQPMILWLPSLNTLSTIAIVLQ